MTESPAPLYIVHTESSLGWGGQEIRVLTEAEAFLKRGHRVEIWAAPGSNILEDANRRGIPSRALPIARRGIGALRALRRALSESRPDVVNTHSSTDSWLIALARLTLPRPPPVVRTRHISAPVSRDYATRWLYSRATCHVVTTGERLREQLVRDLRLRPGRVTSVPTGVDSMRFQPGGKTDARRVLGLNVDDRLVGIVATLRSWKGHRFLVEAFAQLAAEMSDLRLLIVGDGPMHVSIVEQIMRLRLGDRVLLAGRQQAPEHWLQAIDVFCLPSYDNEGVPQAVIQAMLTALPVVTTPVGSITEAVTHEVTGLIVSPRDATAIYAALRRVLTEPDLPERLGRAAREDAVTRFGIDHMVSCMESVFRGVVARRVS